MPIQTTRLESDEDVQRALQMHRDGGRAAVPSPMVGRPGPPDDAPLPFRPTQRAPTALLTVQDDGSEAGQTIRIRAPEFVIGRTEGDLVIPHDHQMSSRHAEIRQALVKDKLRWTLADLNSTNGTYVRIGRALLDDGKEFMIGRTRLRFEHASPSAVAPAKAGTPAAQTTQFWQSPVVDEPSPTIVELSPHGPGHRVLLTTPEIWLGKDSSRCHLVLSTDPFVSARHARVRRDDDGRWVLENNKSVNGVWLRVDRIGFKRSCRFMLGEQQFLVRIPL